MPRPLGPPPALRGGARVVAPEVERVDARLRFDVAAQEAAGEATIEFLAGDVEGRPALDLRQTIEWARLDGQDIDADAFSPVDLGAGPGSEMRVLDVRLEADSKHTLEIGYRIDTPAATGAEPVGWTDGGVSWDFWMSDLEPGRYLEMWVPAPLVHDRFELSLDIQLDNADRPHTLLANTESVNGANDSWSVCYPGHYTALSPMLVLGPTDDAEIRRGDVALPGRDAPLTTVVARFGSGNVDLPSCEADLHAWLSYLHVRYGPWTHGDAFTAVLWSSQRGMEYDGATTSSVPALEHEAFHSWFGRGVKPARAADGWIDEAFTSWATASRRSDQPRFAAEPLTLDEPPVELYPSHPWARQTPTAAYTEGSRLFAALAHMMGGPDRLRSAMAAWYRSNAGGLITTDGLAAHLHAWSGLEISPWWARFVHGRG